MAESNKRSLLIVFVTVFIDLLGFGIVLPLLPRYGEHFHAGKIGLPVLMASFSAMQFLFAPIWGRVSDRVGRRPILILGLAGSTVSYFLFGFATSLGNTGSFLGLDALTWLFITRFGGGIAGATIPTAQAYIADVTDRSNRSRGMALIGAAFGLGFTFGPLIGAPFVPDTEGAPPSPMPGYVAAVLSGCAFLSAVFMLPESLRPGSEAAGRQWFDLDSLKHAIERPSIGMILATMFLTTFAFAQFETTLAMLTEFLGYSQRDNFYVFAFIGVVLAFSQGFLVRRLLPRTGEFRMAVAGTALMIVGLALIAVVSSRQSAGLLIACLPISVVGFSALTPSIQAMLSLQTDESQQGGVLGLGQSMSAVARIFGPLLGVFLFLLAPKGTAPTLPYWSASGMMIGGLLMVLTLRSIGAKAANPEEA